MVVVIPAYKEEGFLFDTLNALYACQQPKGKVGVVVVFNASEKDAVELVERQEWCAQRVREVLAPMAPDWIEVEVLEAYRLSAKHFGAGLARKIGMDATVQLFHREDHPEGILVTLDADTSVRSDYFTAIERWFENPSRLGANIYFEHALEGRLFAPEVYEGITKYELHLRYYMQAHRYAGFPFAFHSMGSAMAMRAVAYARAGGMPRKQAGEDFYFLQKLIPLGGFGEISSTVVYPSPRPSDRVIFGTGAAITGHLDGRGNVEVTYNLKAFEDLRVFFERKSDLFALEADAYENWTYQLSGPMRSFLLNSRFFDELAVLKKDCARQEGFDKRFFEVFNAFKVVKYLNYVHEHFFEKAPVFDMALALLERRGVATDEFLLETELLAYYRSMEVENPAFIS
ncbi:hypothetical protein JCM15548_211 [Geofilum rubicundum JCM 15548]|uniref:Glycosyltransferase 2-like domain-containing protein n=2 Tax=Geofilum TaxID=1236988 RepID=A0A0E9LRD5_9BACT|nr:hypothetical protein JCM15548_211 [Geofilum rubicundum JCM 15548]